MQTNSFISCDWGTSSFRLRMVNVDTKKVIAETRSAEGIAAWHAKWKSSGLPAEKRLTFYLDYIREQVKNLGYPNLEQLPVILSGMASSSIGMMELPYKTVPVWANGDDLTVHTVPEHRLYIVSGLRTDDDVLRGEETMMAGCAVNHSASEQVFLFPGTHSKHLFVTEGKVTTFKTYMTGEMFELLSTKSILANSVKKPVGEVSMSSYFTEGLEKGMNGNLLNKAFAVRANHLFGKINEAGNFAYLSGLVIGSELKDLTVGNQPVTLVCGSALHAPYSRGLQMLSGKRQVQYIDADEALIKGHLQIYHKWIFCGNRSNQ